jgi:hypothetical protein
MRIADVSEIAERLEGVRETSVGGLGQWRLHGRLIARQIDATHVVIRAEIAVRAGLVERHPGTFSVPARFAKHMMVVADLNGDPQAIEDAIDAAWQLQRRNG